MRPIVQIRIVHQLSILTSELPDHDYDDVGVEIKKILWIRNGLKPSVTLLLPGKLAVCASAAECHMKSINESISSL